MPVPAVILISLVIGGSIAATLSVPFGISIILASLLYQIILNFGRHSRFWARYGTVIGGYILDGLRTLVFLLPFLGALLQGFWLIVVAIVIVYFINLFTAYPGA